MIIAIERKRKETFREHLQNQPGIAQMKRRLGQHGLARKKRLGNLFGNAHCPRVMTVARVGQRNQITGIRDTVHFFENPLRVERSRGPLWMTPANRTNFLEVRSPSRACSKCERMNCPCDTPMRAAVSSIQAASFFVGRKVIVLPIWQKCKHRASNCQSIRTEIRSDRVDSSRRSKTETEAKRRRINTQSPTPNF